MSPQSCLVSMIDLTPKCAVQLSGILIAAGYRVETVTELAAIADQRARFPGGLCILAGMRSIGATGLEEIEQLRRVSVGAPVIVVPGHADVPTAVDAVKAGAFDVLVHPFEPEPFLAMVARAHQADAAALAHEHHLNNVRQNYARLTARERDVLNAVTDGMLNKEAAERLGITEKTIKVHRARVMNKMGADSFATLVRMVDAHRHSYGQDHS